MLSLATLQILHGVRSCSETDRHVNGMRDIPNQQRGILEIITSCWGETPPTFICPEVGLEALAKGLVPWCNDIAWHGMISVGIALERVFPNHFQQHRCRKDLDRFGYFALIHMKISYLFHGRKAQLNQLRNFLEDPDLVRGGRTYGKLGS